jgi:hypothetical protein
MANLENLVGRWLAEYRGMCEAVPCAAGCCRMTMTHRWSNLRSFPRAQAEILSVVLSKSEGNGVLIYWDDPIESVLGGAWVKLETQAENQWRIPIGMRATTLLKGLRAGNWVVYHSISGKHLNYQPSDSLDNVCKAMLLADIDIMIDSAHDNGWFALFLAPQYCVV